MEDFIPILTIASLVIAIIFFSISILGWCTYRSLSVIQTLPRTSSTTHIPFDSNKFSPGISLDSHSMTFQYHKSAESSSVQQKEANSHHQTECIICLAPFEEEESVRQLHSCKHIFHTPCIDVWLGSHSGCPLCRTQIDQMPSSPSGINIVASGEQGQMTMVIDVRS